MKYQEALALESDRPIEVELLIELGNLLQQQGIEVYCFDIDSSCFEKCQELLVEKGARHILSIKRLQEAILPKVEKGDCRDLLVRILSSQLQALSPSTNLIVLDSYFFSTKLPDRAEYLNTFGEIFGPVVPKIGSIRFITNPEYNVALYEDTQQILTEMNPKISCSHKTTTDFHDRFWIADEKKGLFIGTSLNGIGKKYALSDFMRDEDTAEIVGVLKRAGLL